MIDRGRHLRQALENVQKRFNQFLEFVGNSIKANL
jgi:hypothetical protein